MRSTVLKVHDALVEAARWAAMSALFALVALVVAAVLVRYFGVFGGSLHWVDEAARFSMVWIVMLGSVVALDRGAHLAVSLLPDALGPRGQRVVLIVANLLSVAFMAVLAAKGWELSQRTMRQVSPSLGLPMGYVYLAIPVGAALMAAQLVAYTLIRRERDPAAVDTSF
jgi:TRAP-type C4-dicarboxylate transport system permease small subunit